MERPLTGRDAELTTLGEMLVELDAAPHGLTLEIAGEPGIGKSRLLRELLTRAGARGHLALSGRAAELETGHPFGVFGDALDDWLVGQPGARIEALAGDLTAELAVVLPAFEALSSGGRPELQEERYRAYRAVRLLLSAMAAEAPVVVALDDVQWADPGSVELVSHLLAHPCRGPVLLALGFRPAQVPARLTVALAAALRGPGARRLDLASLSPAAAGDLLGPTVGRSVRNRLYRESGGNPFFLLQLARGEALARRRPGDGTDLESGVPEQVRAALASELSSLSAPALVLLQGAAVSGDPFDLRLASGAADIDEADAVDLVAELVRFQLVHPASVVGHFAFRHPIVRSIVYQLSTSGWRVRAHARAAGFLARSGASAAAQAPHVELSAAQGDDGAVALLVEAGASSAPRAPALAARWYAAALRLLAETAAAEGRRVEILIALATALGAYGQLEESRSRLVEVLDRLPEQHPERVGVVAFRAGVEHLLGRHRDAHASLSAAHRLVAGSLSAESVLLKIELAAGAGYENRSQEMLDWAEQALDGARALGLRAVEVAAAGQVALARYFLGLPAGPALDRAAAGLDGLGDAELAGRLDLGLWVGWTESVLERHDDAVDHCQRVLDVARSTGQGATLLVTMTAQAWSLIRMGRLSDAEETLDAAIEVGQLAPNLFLSVAVGLSALLATQRGELEAAVRAGEESVRLARSADPGLIPGMSGLYLATPLIELGEAGRAREVLLEMSGGAELRTSRSGHVAAYEVLTRAELARGRLVAAEGWATAAEAATHGEQLAVEAAFAHRARSAVMLARGDPAGAADVALRGAAGADVAGAPVEAGRCRVLAARGLVGAGERARAVAELERAVEELGRVGAHGYRAEAERALRRLGRRTTRRPAAGGDAEPGLRGLTEREREVADLVGRGRTNREISAALFVSEKTVERYLSRIFAKLGVSRRTELALRVASGRDAEA